eukprot:1303486-Rhodomonas_salina.1
MDIDDEEEDLKIELDDEYEEVNESSERKKDSENDSDRGSREHSKSRRDDKDDRMDRDDRRGDDSEDKEKSRPSPDRRKDDRGERNRRRDSDEEEDNKDTDIRREESFDLYGDLEEGAERSPEPDSSAFLPDDDEYKGAAPADEEEKGDKLSAPKQPGSSGSSSQGPRSVVVSKMHWWTSDADLENFLEEKGVRGVTKIQFQEEKSNGKSKGIATVEFNSPYSPSLPYLERRIGSSVNTSALYTVPRCVT